MSSKELYIGNLDPDTKSQEMKDIFEQYGKVNRCEVKFGVSAYSVAFGFVAFESSRDAERAQRKEHGRSHRGRRLIVEFSKTTPGQNRQRSQYSVGNERMKNGNSNGRNRSRSHDRNNSKSRRHRSPSYNQRSSIDRISSDNHRRKRDRSSLSKDYKSSSKQHRSFSNDSKHHISYSSKIENSDKQ
ncbi:unnamed protein product [Rotaria magnacalcarata]|uniref:RRM domain-containing protein n=5 Tax=Rotaria magnacalcarata TaxID=392030 RepID=A0A819YYU3_9BILA|nr:unnamed protein product [Rotaria magnacalcarata]CAF1639556.1 unnamed protein product [Rotaria magnacalcarata]CAF2040619.1 unnamed protein product [Rotaria magnacalcarata]CAF2087724.1 unnamed protein product [Rotaria magnacalcarata]CAF2137685.1 unnamed protein product [Rotaria magnacalcarata]